MNINKHKITSLFQLSMNWVNWSSSKACAVGWEWG